MARPKSSITIKLEKIATRAGISPKYARELHRRGMPLEPLKAALAWLADRPTPDTEATGDDSPAALRKERIRLTRAQSEKAEHLLAIQRGEFVSIEEHHECGARLAAVLQAAFRALEQNLPPALQGLEIHQSRPRCRDEIRKIQTMLSEDDSGLWRGLAVAD